MEGGPLSYQEVAPSLRDYQWEGVRFLLGSESALSVSPHLALDSIRLFEGSYALPIETSSFLEFGQYGPDEDACTLAVGQRRYHPVVGRRYRVLHLHRLQD